MARLTGNLGAVYVGAVGDSNYSKVADVYDWAFDTTTEMHPVDIKGDKFHKVVPGGGGARFTAKRRVEAGAVFSAFPKVAANSRTQLLFRLDLIDNNNSFSQVTGQGYASAGTFSAPLGVADDTIEVTFDGIWTQS